MEKRILYLSTFLKGDYRVVGHGYAFDDEVESKKSSNVPAKHYLTNVGYIKLEEVKKIPHELVTPTNFFVTLSSNENQFKAIANSLLKIIKEAIGRKTHLVVLDLKIMDFLELLKDGETVDGLKFIEVGITPEEYFEVNKILKDLGDDFTFDYELLIEGHIGKNFCIELSGIDSKEEAEYITFEETKYWKPVKVANPLLTAKQIFYDPSEIVYADTYKYITINYKEEIEVGRSLSSPMFASIHLSEPIPLIESYRNALKEVMGDNSSVSTVRLEVMNQIIPLVLFRDFGKRAFVKNEIDLIRYQIPNITVGKSYEVAAMINPPGLARSAMDNIGDIDNILLNYRAGKLTKEYEVINITDMFYDLEKKTIRSDIPMSSVIVKYKHKDYLIPLYLTSDLPSRNHLKRMEKQEPKVTLILKHEENSIESFVTIELMDGSYAIFTALYSNRIMKKALKKK